MSSLVKSTRCPRCASKGGDKSGNNLAIYSDGHEWCYACGFYKPANIVDKYIDRKNTPIRTDRFNPSNVFDVRGIKWLKQYGLSNQEIQDNFFWDDTGYCVFNGVMFHNGRNFNGVGPKYKTKGSIKGNEVIFRSSSERLLSSCVIVEDAISAIKVSRVCDAVAIHNAVIPLELLIKLSRLYKNLFIWLDKDKSKEMLGEANKASPYFDSVRVVFSDLDPKCYNEVDIKEKLC